MPADTLRFAPVLYGHMAYEAYVAQMPPVPTHPAWNELPPAQRAVWIGVALAVLFLNTSPQHPWE